MRDPARLLDEGATAAELSLLRAGLSEEPSEQAAKRLAVVLGLASGAVVSTVSLKSSAAGSVARGVLSKFAAKWVLLGALGVASGVALVAGRGHGASHDGQGAGRASTAIAGGEAHPAVAPATPVDQAGSPASPTAATPIPVPVATDVPSTPVVVSQTPARGSPSIAREIAALDVARRLLGSGNSRGALRALDDYDRSMPSGVLGQEAALLRIEALARAGNLTAARRLAARFLHDHPRSPHEKRIRALVGESP